MKFRLFFIFLFSLPIYAQDGKNDYIKWSNKADEYYRVNNDSTIFYAKKMQISAANSCEYIKGLSKEASSIYFKRDCKLSIEKCLVILETLEENKLNLDEACYAQTKGGILSRLMYAEKCLRNYTTALEYIEKNEILYKKYQTYFKGKTYSLWYQSALIHIHIGEVEETIFLLNKSLDSIVLSNYDELSHASIHTELTAAYTILFTKNKQQQYHLLDSARIHNNKYFEIASSIKSQELYTKKIFELLNGRIELLNKNYEKALTHLRKSKAVVLTEEKYFTDQDIDFFIAKNFSKLANSDSTIFYSNQYLKKFKKHPYSFFKLVIIYDNLASEYNKIKNKDSSYKYASLALKGVKKIAENRNKTLKFKYDLDIKKIKSSNEAILNAKENQLVSLKTVFIISVLLLILLLFRLLIVRNTMKKKFEAIIRELNEKENQYHKKGNDLIIKDAIAENILLGLKKMEENKAFLQSNFDLKYVANSLNSNTSYVSKVFNENKNESFKSYLNNLRINFIVKELKNNSKLRKYSLDAIAKDIGYSNGSSFSKIFKKTTGINPSYFISKLNKEN